MPALPLPDRPDLEWLRRRARELQRAVRAGEPAALARMARHGPPSGALTSAQLVVAREHGFPSWPRLRRYVGTVAEHGWPTSGAEQPSADPADEFCRLACLTYTPADGPGRWAAARRLLDEHPGLTDDHIWAAAAAGAADAVRRLTAGDPRLATARGGPFRWRPLCYLAYSRTGHERAAALAIVDALLAAGADAEEGYLFDGLPYPFTALTGLIGGGEQGPARQPRHPHWRPLAERLLAAGADPNDAQALYNTMFEPDNAHLKLLFAHGLGRPHDGAWRHRVGDLVPPPAELLRTQLRWAVEHDQRERVHLLGLEHVDVVAPYPADGRTPLQLALLYGRGAIAADLLALGAPPPPPDPVAELIAAAFRGDRAAVEALRRQHPGVVDDARRQRPGLVVWAAASSTAETVELLVGLGFDVNARGRADAPIEQEWETALHHAAGAGDVELARRLLALGADPQARDHRFGATPLDWARHQGQPATAGLLAR